MRIDLSQETASQIAERLQSVRKVNRLTQTALATRSRVSNKTIVALERKTLAGDIGVDVLVRLSYALDGMEEVRHWLELVGAEVGSDALQSMVADIDANASLNPSALLSKLEKLDALKYPNDIKDEVSDAIMDWVGEKYEDPQEIKREIHERYEQKFATLEEKYERKLATLEETILACTKRVNLLEERLLRFEERFPSGAV